MGGKKLNEDNLVNSGLNIIGKKIRKGISSITFSGITLTNNEKKDIMKVSKSVENREILLKGTTRKITSQEERFFNFLKRLVTVGLPLTRTVLMPFAKSVLSPLGLLAAIQNNIYGSGTTALINSNEEMQDTMKIVKSLEE